MDAEVRELLSRLGRVEEELAREDVLSDQKRYKVLSQEHARLIQIKEAADRCEELKRAIEGHRALLRDEKDPDLLALVTEELPTLEAALAKAAEKLDHLILPPDPRDDRSIILELRAGTGGDEAAIFVGNCVRMYTAYATSRGWKVEPLSCAESERGGFKEYIFVLSGPQVFRLMQYEGGTHRVQRVPETETQGRVHTSAITVAVLLEPDEEERVVIEEKDLRIDTFRASGAGGQHVNRTDSAVRHTHLPTGIVVACQEERSQHKNRDKAMRLLGAKIAEKRRLEAEAQMASARSQQVGSGDRSEKIRTYNFPQNRVTDHRIGLTLYSLGRVMDGDLDPLTLALVSHFYKEKRKAAAGHGTG